MQADQWPAGADTLDDASSLLRLSDSFYCHSSLTAPWGLSLPPDATAMWVHAVTHGRCWLEAGGQQARELGTGDIALLPRGEGHRLVSAPGARSVPFDSLSYDDAGDRYATLHHGSGGVLTTVVCGTVHLAHRAADVVISLLPRVIVVDEAMVSGEPEAEWIDSTLRWITAEGRRSRPGSGTIVTRLSDVIVTRALQHWWESETLRRPGWLGALDDPYVGRAISLVHRDPGRPWSVALLAAELNLSRSAFAARFTERVGEPVMRYVTRWRMAVALDALQRDDVSVAQLATRLGYDSPAAFSRAFKRTTGASPAAIGRAHPRP